jgi:hypothetical protein
MDLQIDFDDKTGLGEGHLFSVFELTNVHFSTSFLKRLANRAATIKLKASTIDLDVNHVLTEGTQLKRLEIDRDVRFH